MLLALKNISKNFSGIKALQHVSINIEAGKVHALCGENGAGKSTLMNIISGSLKQDEGDIVLNEKKVAFGNPLEAQQNGIAIVHQERSLFDELTIAENIFAGQQPKTSFGFIDYDKLFQKTRELLDKLHLDFLSPRSLVKTLSAAHRQMVEIAKALAKKPSILILDEPTASVTQTETDVLFSIIKDLKAKGASIIYISHRIQEIFSIADEITVLKDGQYVATKNIGQTSQNDLIRMMVGRDIQSLKKHAYAGNEMILEVKHLSGRHFSNISITVHKGEIVGLAGLVGAGRSEIARSIFGADKYESGDIIMHQEKQYIQDTNDAIHKGIAYVPEERKTQALFEEMSIEDNIIASGYIASGRCWFNRQQTSTIAKENVHTFSIASTNIQQPVKSLSGGNQQKVVLAKWLLPKSDILIVDEPTHGVDVGAKFEIYKLLQQQAAAGKAILLISSELPELLLLSDTIYVLYKGSIKKKLAAGEATEEAILHYASGFD